jgi:hypothetical protein
MALDVCYTLNQFCAPLPETYGDFKAMATTFLPNIIDTKVFLTLATSAVDLRGLQGHGPGLWIRIRIRIGSVFNWKRGSGSVFGIRIRIQEGKNDPKK